MSDALSQVSVTPMMSRSFEETNSLKADILFHNDRAFSKQIFMFLTDRPRFKLMSPEKIKIMDLIMDHYETVCHLTTVGLQGKKSSVATVQR